ncbi:scavenger receptor cysteine-rich type 1 protein M160 isoform X2 [Megalobrama amblycephala]|uniref:scavenger receptor cysteine-rich type 1 protein M160 isoform X2 n=1 Tax=Megalobrama amblycephala TaxID=75352 RepID=UPI002014443B|nr:scavenger receptor cysteine-rich type 1 protein M160 isoform X2 [Megalobrama amblycephala]
MWFLLLYLQISAIQGLNVILSGSDSPCKGRLQVRRDSKSPWGLVCHYGWTSKNGEVVCKSLRCGDVVRSGMQITLYRDPPLPEQYLMDQVNCESTETSLWNCTFSPAVECKGNSSVYVECSGNVKPSLNLNGQRDKCAGVVEFSTESGTFGVCNSDWNEKNADKICQEVNCGGHYRIPNPGIFQVQQREQNVLLNWDAKYQHSWQSIEWKNCKQQASVICTKHTMFRLQDGNNLCSGLVEMYNITGKTWVPLQKEDVSAEVICTQLNCGTTGNFTNNGSLQLTCSVNATLRNFTSKCFGDVSFLVNGSDYGVCFGEHKNLGKVVCRELGCGEVVDVIKTQTPSSRNGLLSIVECQGNEESLWHCLANRDKKLCPTTTVICAGSLDVRLSDGLGQCSGRVELQWEGSWLSISSKDWADANSDMVCEHLKCGKSATKKLTKKYFIERNQHLESRWSFKCESSSTKLHECLKKSQSPPHSPEANMQIICQKEELRFFEGDSPCQGRIRIKSFDDKAEAYWLPNKMMAENMTEANDICYAMQCGNGSFVKEPNSTYANVTCSGPVSVKLQNKRIEQCWGTVEVCRNGTCGGVCSDTWGYEESKKICDNLGCGEPIPGQLTTPTKSKVTEYSVYCLEEVNKMSMCKFLPNNGICNKPAQVMCAGSVKAKLEDPRDKCAGNVSLFYLEEWTPVCEESLNTELKKVICRELNCGEPDASDVTLRDKSQIKGISGIQCPTGTSSFSRCNLKSISYKTKCNVGYLKCSGRKRLLLYEPEGPCSGPVYALSGEKTQLISAQGWGPEEGQKLCEYLQCGNYTNHTTIPRENKEDWRTESYNCSGKADLWECERKDQDIQLKEQLNIKCDGNPDIKLSNRCTGEVLINNESVCASHLNTEMSNDLCDSLKCGKAIHHWSTAVPVKTNCYHFSCTGKETLLWQCGFEKDKCANILSVACEKSIEFGSTEKCGGKLVVKYRGQWEYVCGKLNEIDTENVCKVLNCTSVEKPVDKMEISQEIKVTINCLAQGQSLSQCVRYKEEKCTHATAEIQCEGYVRKGKPPMNFGLIVGLSLGVLGLLIMVFLWMNRKRLLLALRHYRNKNGKDINIDSNEMNNMEKEDRDLSQGKASLLDYDYYEDVDSDKNKTNVDADDRSQGSSGTEYDDIEGQNGDISPHQTHNDDNLPLLPKRPDNILDQDTYEVETENQEEYDDVMPVEAAADENAETADTQAQMDVAVDAGTDSEAGTGVNADAVVVTAEVEVHAEQE